MLDAGRSVPAQLQSEPKRVKMQAMTVKNQTGHDSLIGLRHISIQFGVPPAFIAIMPAIRPANALHCSQKNIEMAAASAQIVSLYDQDHLPLTNKASVTAAAPTVQPPASHPGLLFANVIARRTPSIIVHISQLAGVEAGILRVQTPLANQRRIPKATKPPK